MGFSPPENLNQSTQYRIDTNEMTSTKPAYFKKNLKLLICFVEEKWYIPIPVVHRERRPKNGWEEAGYSGISKTR